MAACDDSNSDLAMDSDHDNHHSSLLFHVHRDFLVPCRIRLEKATAHPMRVSQQTMAHPLNLSDRDDLNLVAMAHLECFHEHHSLVTGLCLEVMMVFDRLGSFRFCPIGLCRGLGRLEMAEVLDHLLDFYIHDLALELGLDCRHASHRDCLVVVHASL